MPCTFCPPAQRYMTSAEAAVPTPIKRQQEVRLPGTKLTGNAQAADWLTMPLLKIDAKCFTLSVRWNS